MAYHGNSNLYRDKDEGMIGGVCAGLSEAFKIDVTILRIIVGALVFLYGTGLGLYILLWILLPDKRNLV